MSLVEILLLVGTTLGFGLILNERRKDAETKLKLVELKVKDEVLTEEQLAVKQAADDLDRGIQAIKDKQARRVQEESTNVLSLDDRKNAWKDRK